MNEGGRAAATGTSITLVVVTRDRWAQLSALLPRIRAGSPGNPLIVIDNAGAAPVPTPLAAAPDVRVLRSDRDLGPAARNLGVRCARTEFVAFCDDDAWWQPGALAIAAGRLSRSPELGGVVGRVLVEPRARLDPVSAAHERDGTVVGFLATALVVRREAFLSVGGYHERLGFGGEEDLLAMRFLSAGHDLVYEPDAVLHHRPAARTGPMKLGRERTVVRNALWTAWLRRPWRVAAIQTMRALRSRAGNCAVVPAVAGARWVLAEREVNPPEVEERLRRASAATPPARRARLSPS
jgi:GT2 family glycosyltransferase